MDTVEKYRRYVNTSFVKAVEPVVVESASGATVRSVEGREYLDCFAGIAVVNAGHNHPKVTAAAKAQIDKLVHAASYLYYVPAVADLAELLAQISPGALEKTFFCNSGAEAVEGAMRLARLASGKREAVALQMGFHGRSYGTLSLTGNARRKTRGGPYMGGVAFAPAPHCYRCPFGLSRDGCGLACANAVEDVIKYQTSDDVAFFIVEPVLGEAGIIPLPEGYLQRVKEILDRHGVMLLVDEVQTGFGRTGAMFGVEHHGVVPDLMAMAKGIADGFPLGAFIAPSAIADSFQPGEHLSTFGGNPVACAAALASIGVVIEEGLVERAASLGAWALEELRSLAEQQELVGDVRGQGLMLGVELVSSRQTKAPAAAAAAKVRELCREDGVLIGVGGQDGNVVRVQPPLVITSDELERALRSLGDALARVEAGAAGD